MLRYLIFLIILTSRAVVFYPPSARLRHWLSLPDTWWRFKIFWKMIFVMKCSFVNPFNLSRFKGNKKGMKEAFECIRIWSMIRGKIKGFGNKNMYHLLWNISGEIITINQDPGQTIARPLLCNECKNGYYFPRRFL